MTVLDIYCRELGGALRYAKQFGERRSFFFSRYCILFSSSFSYVDLSLDTLTYMFSFFSLFYYFLLKMWSIELTLSIPFSY